MKKIILTGSASGFGYLAAKTLAAKGYTVYATMRNVNGANAAVAAELKQWAADNQASLEVVELDITNDQSVATAVAEITKKTGGKIDVLINNAGISHISVSEALSIQQADQIFQVNVIGADRMMKAVLPFMHQQRDGLIINVTSVLSRMHVPMFATYNASKAALDALSVGYHYELATAGIDVVTIQPGGYPSTDIITKGVQPANPAVEANYGERMHKLKQASIQMFTPNENSPNPQAVADVMLQLVEQPKGERPLWNLVGAEVAEPIDHINQSTKALVDTMLGYMGV
jgi:NAD(P)-dependent dehydrogenase (short-subunit alcohol dehydrogenase family)